VCGGRGRVRVTAQLVRVCDQIHLWADNFDRPSQSILDIHSEVGAAIASQVKLELTPEDKRQLRSLQTVDQQAYDLYLYHWARLTHPEMQKAIEYFRKATERDPRFALAFSGFADSLMTLPINSDVAPKDVFPEAKAAIAKALGNLWRHTIHDAALKFRFDWNFGESEGAAREAIKLDSNYSLAHLYLAHVLSNVGRHDEALAAILQARVLDPFSLITNAMYGQFLFHAGRDSEVVSQLKATLEMEPHFWVAHICLAKAYEKLDKHSEALAACENAWKFSGGVTAALSIAGYVHAVAGDKLKAECKIKEMMERKRERYAPPLQPSALVFADLRDTEAALRWLQQAFEDRDVHMNFLLDHKWNKLRNNPHFRPMLPARSKVRSLTKAAKALRGTGSLEGACTNPQ
jgi:tetratricopeptide (TPR) repeat protein